MPATRRLREHWVRTGHRDRLTSMVRERIRTLEGTVLDVGGGRDAPHDASWSPRARRIRVDVSLAHRPHVVGDALRLPIRDAAVDAVTCFEVLEHVRSPWTAIDEMGRVLRPGGVLMGSVPLVWPIHGDPDDYFRFTDSGIRALLERFTETSVVAIGNHLSSAWIILSARSRTLRVLNPLMRRFGRRADAWCPEGYLFSARR